MSSTKTHLTVNLARRCLPLLQDVHRSYILAHEGFKEVLIVAGDAVPADAPPPPMTHITSCSPIVPNPETRVSTRVSSIICILTVPMLIASCSNVAVHRIR